MPQKTYDDGIKVHVLILSGQGLSQRKIAAATGVPQSTVCMILKRAKSRGWDPLSDDNEKSNPLLRYVQDATRSGRPPLATEEKKKDLISVITRNSTTRQYSAQQIADAVYKKYKWRISPSTVRRILAKAGYKNVKLTTKPGLNTKQRLKRLWFCYQVKDWTLEDWAQVIWSDETSVMLNVQRGKRRCWRRPDEVNDEKVIRTRWKGRKEFMVWACFTFHHKGPMHFWKPETKQQEQEYKNIIDDWNTRNEARLKEEWELNTGLQRMTLGKKKRGRKPTWRFTKVNGKMVRDSKAGGIDWIRYQKEVLQPLYWPFIDSLPGSKRDWIAQEDNAPAHSSKWNQAMWRRQGYICLYWPPNSPDLSAIEPPWGRLKWKTSSKKSRGAKALVEAWKLAWKDMPQKQLQQYVVRIMNNVKWVLFERGRNTYKEGSDLPDISADDWAAVIQDVELKLWESLDEEAVDSDADESGWADVIKPWTTDEKSRIEQRLKLRDVFHPVPKAGEADEASSLESSSAEESGSESDN
jgi:transposase